MTKTARTLSMITSLAIIASSIGTASAFAASLFDPEHDFTGFTETDIDVTVDADMGGTEKPVVDDSTPENIEDNILHEINNESHPKIYVEVDWDELKFVYDFGTVVDYEWNIKKTEYEPIYEYKYGDNKGPAWSKNSADIRFKNLSNRDVYTGVSFELNHDVDTYDNVEVTFDKSEILLFSAAKRGPQLGVITMNIEGTPKKEYVDEKVHAPSLGRLKFYISEETRIETTAPEAPAEETTASGEHECHFVYDQFGRLVCTGCDKVKHEFCVDEDEDGICDECGTERDFCPDCHVGGKCICVN